MSGRQEKKLAPFTFSASVGRLLRPVSSKMKRLGKLKVSPRVHGKIMELPSGSRVMIVERKGRDIWRGRHKSLHEALKAGDAGIGVDRILLKKAKEKHDVKSVMVVIEEQGKLFTAPIDAFFDQEKSSTRSGWNDRVQRVLGYHHFVETYLGPNLKKKRKKVIRPQNPTCTAVD